MQLDNDQRTSFMNNKLSLLYLLDLINSLQLKRLRLPLKKGCFAI